MAGYPLGTVLASPVVGGSSADTYGTHFSFLGIGGYLELATVLERNQIPVGESLDATELSSGRRRLGMLCYVSETNTTYQLYVPYETWNGYNNAQKLAALASNDNWLETDFKASGTTGNTGGVDYSIFNSYTASTNNTFIEINERIEDIEDAISGGGTTGGTTYIFKNGLTKDGINVKLGGELIEDTSVYFDNEEKTIDLSVQSSGITLSTLGKSSSSSIGLNQWTTHNNGDYFWNEVEYLNGLFVALSSSKIGTSSDGVTWNIIDVSPGAWGGVAYGYGKYVAVGTNQTKILYSYEGTTWLEQETGYYAQWNCITFGNDRFVALSNTTGVVMVSTDGENWTTGTTFADYGFNSIMYAEGLFVATVAGATDDGKNIATSPDGFNWTMQNTSQQSLWVSCAYGNGLFVAVSKSGSFNNRIYTSPDAISWTLRQAPNDCGWMDIAFGDGLFVAVGETNGTGFRSMYSSDGINWFEHATPVDNNWQGVTFGDGKFVAVAATGSGNRSMIAEKAEITTHSGLAEWKVTLDELPKIEGTVSTPSGSTQSFIMDEEGISVTAPKGIEYTSDFSTAFTKHSLVDVNYVTGITSTLTGITGTSLTADNGGLTIEDGNIRLGGKLTGTTFIQVDEGSFILNSQNSNTTFALTNFNDNEYITFQTHKSGYGAVGFTFDITGSLYDEGAKFYDTRTIKKGIEYQGDYSTGFTKHSLVDVNYVTGITSSLTGGTGGVSKEIFDTYTGTTDIRLSTLEALTGSTDAIVRENIDYSSSIVLDLEDVQQKRFVIDDAVSGNINFSFTNTGNVELFTIDLSASTAVSLNMPATVRMQKYESDNERWNTSTRTLDLAIGVYTLTFAFDGTLYKLNCSEQYI